MLALAICFFPPTRGAVFHATVAISPKLLKRKKYARFDVAGRGTAGLETAKNRQSVAKCRFDIFQNELSEFGFLNIFWEIRGIFDNMAMGEVSAMNHRFHEIHQERDWREMANYTALFILLLWTMWLNISLASNESATAEILQMEYGWDVGEIGLAFPFIYMCGVGLLLRRL